MATDREAHVTAGVAVHCFPRLRSWAESLSTALRGERRDAVENRQRILTAARELIARQGIESVSMHDIAQSAGVGQGTLYRRYPHKGALCHALLEENIQRFHDALVARLEAETNTLPALAQLRQFIEALLTFTEENGPLASAMGDSACGVTLEERYQSPWAVWQRETTAILVEQAVARGEIGPLDLEATVDLIHTACDPTLYLYQRHQRGYSQARIVANLLRLLAGPNPVAR